MGKKIISLSILYINLLTYIEYICDVKHIQVRLTHESRSVIGSDICYNDDKK